MHRLGKRAKSRMGLSGTPIPQGPLDAYGIFRFLDPVIFGTRFAAFRARYAVMGGFQGYQVIGYQNMEEFNRKFGSITFHIEENAVSLPEYIDIKVPIQMPKNAWSAYHEMAKEFCTWLESGENVTAPNTLAKLMRLQQITSGFLPTETESPSAQKITQLHDAKAQAMIDIIADTDDPVVIFYRFSHDGHEIRKKLEKRNLEILEISGQQNDYDRFREGESRILLAQIQSASEGIDLTRCGDRPCNRAIYYSIGFISSASYKQSRARIRRPGQTETCFYHHLVVPGSIDETVYQNMDDKEKLIRTVYEGSHKLNIN